MLLLWPLAALTGSQAVGLVAIAVTVPWVAVCVLGPLLLVIEPLRRRLR